MSEEQAKKAALVNAFVNMVTVVPLSGIDAVIDTAFNIVSNATGIGFTRFMCDCDCDSCRANAQDHIERSILMLAEEIQKSVDINMEANDMKPLFGAPTEETSPNAEVVAQILKEMKHGK